MPIQTSIRAREDCHQQALRLDRMRCSAARNREVSKSTSSNYIPVIAKKRNKLIAGRSEASRGAPANGRFGLLAGEKRESADDLTTRRRIKEEMRKAGQASAKRLIKESRLDAFVPLRGGLGR